MSLKQLAVIAGLLAVLTACSVDETPVPAPAPTTPPQPAGATAPPPAKTAAPAQPAPAPTVSGPTAIPANAPLAARVNGKPIALAEFDKEVARRQAEMSKQGINFNTAEGRTALDVLRMQTLDGLIEQELINQEAAKLGVTVSDAEVEAAVKQSIADTGGQEAFNKYLTAVAGMTLDEYRLGQRYGMLNERMIERLTRTIPMTAEQVHARHILSMTPAEANALLAQLRAGADFGQLAQQYSKDTITSAGGGDLGWFPRGGLFDAALETAAFELQPGQIGKAPVASDLGGGQMVYHIVQVIERDPARTLSEDALLAARQTAFQRWLDGVKAAAQIDRLVK